MPVLRGLPLSAPVPVYLSRTIDAQKKQGFSPARQNQSLSHRIEVINSFIVHSFLALSGGQADSHRA